MNKYDLKDLSIEELEELVNSLREKVYRGRQVFEWIFQKDAAETGEMTNLSLNLRNRLNEISYISRLSIADKRTSKDGTIKYLFELPPITDLPSPLLVKEGIKGRLKGGSGGVSEDGNSIESVLISDKGRLTLCISTQVGCKLNCSFCLTGKTGFVRNLKHSEIIEQVLSVKRDIRTPLNPLLCKEGVGEVVPFHSTPLYPPLQRGEVRGITNLVLMGMGEPLDNYENVIKSIKTMVSPHGLKIPAKKITLSTAGLIPEIISLAKENLKINLAVSLNAADNKTRDKIMPINKRHPLGKLLEALREYPLSPGRRITIEYVMIKGINDTLEDAVSLSNILKGLRCKINLIPFNSFEGSDYESPDYKNIEEFQKFLISKNYTAIIRNSKGADICAACGQLRSKIKNQSANIKIKESIYLAEK